MNLLKSIIGLIAGIVIGTIAVIVIGTLIMEPLTTQGNSNAFTSIAIFLLTFPGAIILIGFFGLCGATGSLSFTMSDKKRRRKRS